MTDEEKIVFNSLHQALNNLIDARCAALQCENYAGLNDELEVVDDALWNIIKAFERNIAERY